jgi:hypothetical protein
MESIIYEYNTVVDMTVANTLTFESIDLGFDIRDKKAIRLKELLIYPSMTDFLAEMITAGDRYYVGISTSDDFATPIASRRDIVYQHRFFSIVVGAPTTIQLREWPVKVSFNPPEGLLVMPWPLYAFAYSEGFANPCDVNLRLSYEIVTYNFEELVALTISRLQ